MYHKPSRGDKILCLLTFDGTGMAELAPACVDRPVELGCTVLFTGMPVLLPDTPGIEDRGFPNILLRLWHSRSSQN